MDNEKLGFGIKIRAVGFEICPSLARIGLLYCKDMLTYRCWANNDHPQAQLASTL